jgi:signal transduction histidine kinase
MNYKQIGFQNKLITPENKDPDNKQGFEVPNLKEENENDSKITENDLRFRLQEMSELNALLENIIEQRTDKLIEVVADNTRFISIIAHDLRNPFSSILGALELLKDRLDRANKYEVEKYINIASNSAKKTLALLDDLLKWAISKHNENNFNPVKIILYDLLVEEIEDIIYSANQKNISITNSTPPELKIYADRQMVKTIIRNSISNALKFTRPGGKINISTSYCNEFIEIVIKDNGIGISIESQKNLFVGGFRSTTGTKNEKGTGLGLILCKEFVEMHGGIIQIESEPGNGFEMKFTLPHYNK